MVTHPRFFDEQFGSAVGAIDHVEVVGIDFWRQFPFKFMELTFAIASRQLWGGTPPGCHGQPNGNRQNGRVSARPRSPASSTSMVITLHPTPHTRHPTPYTLHAPYTLHPSPYILHPTPYTLHPTPYTLHPSPYILHPTPYTLHPTPYALHPTLLQLRSLASCTSMVISSRKLIIYKLSSRKFATQNDLFWEH